MSLPILSFEMQIVDTVANNHVTVIQADTGAGKSTQVPQMLYLSGNYKKITITQPRVIAAISLAARVSEELHEEIGNIVGYKTRFYKTENDTPITYVTDGYLLSTYKNRENYDSEVIILDEIHEFNVNLETLLGLYKKELAFNRNLKLVVMSATIDAESISNFFDGAPIIKVPGKSYPVKKLWEPTCLPSDCVIKYFTPGTNMLVFLPGKQEIANCYELVEEYFLKNSEETMPQLFQLHSKMTYDDQKQVFSHYKEGKIIFATNVAQTSITVPDVDFVIDTGICKEMVSDNGVSKLVSVDISQADCEQRAGRAGRCKTGTYVLCSSTDLAHRRQFPVPEIQRISLENLVLKLSTMGLDPTKIEFLHNPDQNNLRLAKKLLEDLGALRDGSITEIGVAMEKMPVSARTARMLLEAQKYSPNVQGDIAIIAAIFECGDFRDKYFNLSLNASSECKKSDLTYQLLLIKEINRLWHSLSYYERKDFYRNRGITSKIYQNILKVAKDIADKLNLKYTLYLDTEESDYVNIRNCIIAAFHDCLYSFSKYYRGARYEGDDYTSRTFDRNSVFVDYWAETPAFVLAQPLNIYCKSIYGHYTIYLLRNVTVVDQSNPFILQHLLDKAEWEYFYNRFDKLVYKVYKIGNHEIKREVSNKVPVLVKESNSYYHVLIDGITIDLIPA